jgi:glycosyltransferase involved in cell wall biosynthesis
LFRYIYIPISRFIQHYLRIWDVTAVRRIDHLVSISQFIRKKVWKRYRRDSQVIYPGIDDIWFKPVTQTGIEGVRKKYRIPEKYFLIASRLYDQKKIDWAIEACKRTGETLVVVGTGPDRPYLHKIARGHKNIIFTDFVSDDDLLHLYHGAQAFLFCNAEDFGFVIIEAMACGTPVFAFHEGAAKETVIDGKTGEFFGSIEELEKLLKKSTWKKYNKSAIINRAKEFSEENFINSFTRYLEKIYKEDKAK